MSDRITPHWHSILAAADERPLGRESDKHVIHRIRASTTDPLYIECYAGLVRRMRKGPLTLGQIGQSLDGRIATETGHSSYISSPESLDHLHRLRSLVDAVIVGATTVVLDDPLLTTRRVPGPNPVRVVIDPKRRLDARSQVLTDRTVDTIIVTRVESGITGSDGVTILKIPAIEGIIPPAAILSALRERGLGVVLIEGGSRTLSMFLSAGLIDRLHVMVAPLILGSGQVGLQLPEIAHVDDGIRPDIRHYRLGKDTLFDCYMRHDAGVPY